MAGDCTDPPILFGLEWELAQGLEGPATEPLDHHAAYLALRKAICRRSPWLPDAEGAAGVFTPAFRFYLDCGLHPEVAGIELADPVDLLRVKHAIFALLGQAVGDAARTVPGLVLLANNHNHLATDRFWGCHESYALRCPPGELARGMLPFLASRPLLAGSGWIDRQGVVRASPRSSAMHQPTGGGTTCERALFSTAREQPLMNGGPFGFRAHLLCGDSCRAPLSEYLKVSTTALTLIWLQAERCGADDLHLADPLRLLRSADVLWKPTGRLHICAAALELQQEYCRRVSRFVDAHPGLPDWCGQAVVRWSHVLEVLRDDPLLLTDRLDPFIKLALFDAALDELGCRWRDVAAKMEVYELLALLDAAYHRLGAVGPYDKLLEANRVCADGLPQYGTASALPELVLRQATRAAGRARVIVQHSGSSNYRCGWTGIQRQSPPARLSLDNPVFAGEVRWEPQPGRTSVAATLAELLRHPF